MADEAGLRPGAVLAGRTTLGELAVLTADASLVLSGDTGMAHLAAAYRRPTVTLGGPVPPRLWGPPPRPGHQVVWAGTRGNGSDRENPGDPHGREPDPRLLDITPGETVTAALKALSVAQER